MYTYTKDKKGKKDLNELKKEMDIDEHKIPIAELYKRLKSHPENVRIISITIVARHVVVQ